jgi:hypothetical protein
MMRLPDRRSSGFLDPEGRRAGGITQMADVVAWRAPWRGHQNSAG